MKGLKKWNAVAVFMLLAILACTAGTSLAAEDKFVKECPPDQIIFSTGVAANTFHQGMLNYMQLVPGVICHRTDSRGGNINVEYLLGLNGDAEAALVPMDVMEFMRRTNPDVTKLRSICSLWPNALHIIVNKNGYKVSKYWGATKEVRYVSDFADLENLSIAVFGSPEQSVQLIMERMGKPNFFSEIVVAKDVADGKKRLDEGKVQAFLVMGGYPISYINDLDPAKFTLATVDPGLISKLGAPYKVVKLNYPKLGVNGFNTLAAVNEVIVRDYDDPEWVERFIKLYKGFSDNLKKFKQMRGGHPAWRGVEDIDNIYWTPYAPVREYVKQQGKSPVSPAKAEEQPAPAPAPKPKRR